MAGNIKGITIEFQGDTSRLDKALRTINNNTRKLDKELRNVDKALKFNPTSVELWRQKQQLLTQKINETKTKLDVLKKAQAQMDAEGVDKNSEEYRNLQREIIETESKLKNFQAQQRKIGNVNLRAASEQFKVYGERLTAAGQAMKGVSMAAAGLVASLGAVAVKAGKSADDLDTLSEVTGIGTGNLQKYSYAADLVDVSVEAIAKSNKKLTKSAYDAANGSKSQAAAFDAIGVSVVDSNGNLRDSEAIFQDVITALGQMTNETERDALAQKLMGKSAAELNPLIEDGGETYKMVADTLKKYDLDYVDQETLDKANEFNDDLDTMKMLGKVALAQVGSKLAAQLAPALEKVVDLVGKFAEWLGNLDPKILTVIGAVGGVVAAIAPVLLILGKLSFAISSILSLASTIGPIIGAIAGPIGIVVAVIAGIIAAFIIWRKHGDKIKKFFADFGKKIVEVWNQIKEGVAKAIEAVKTTVSKVFTAIKTIIMTLVKGYVTYIRLQFTLIKTIITTVINAIKIVISTVFNAIKIVITTYVNAWKTIISTAWTLIKTVVSNAVTAIKTKVSTVFNSIKQTVSTIWNGIKTAITNAITNAKNAVSKTVDAIKTKVSGGFNGISAGVKKAFNAVKEAITSPIDKAKELVKKAVDTIKGIFPIKLGKIFSGVQLPHFKISGGSAPWGIGGKGTKPSISIDWYKRAMDNPYMFSNATLIGAGEAGDEILYGRNSLMRDISNAVSSANSGGGDEITINVYATPEMDVKVLAAEVERRLIESQKRRTLAWQ